MCAILEVRSDVHTYGILLHSINTVIIKSVILMVWYCLDVSHDLQIMYNLKEIAREPVRALSPIPRAGAALGGNTA